MLRVVMKIVDNLRAYRDLRRRVRQLANSVALAEGRLARSRR